MALSEQDAIDAISSEKADLVAFGSLLAKLFAAVEALRNTPPASPDFQKVVDAVVANHDLVTAAFKAATDEDAKVEPPAPPPPPPAPTLTVSPTSLALTVGGAPASISASASDSSAPAFASSDASVATVDASGMVTPVAAGSCTISVTTPTIATASVVSVTVS